MTEDEGIFREVDEAVRNDNLKVLWNRAGRYIVWLAVAVLFLTIVYVAWTSYLDNLKEQRTMSFYKAVMLAEQGSTTEAMKIFGELSTSQDTSFETLSKIWIIKLL